ncbi:protein MTSS 1-like isoform X2 [Sardina pilchardus]|uniref:protein MTSS 1-like isoform X2 n=1 Tax=Sardina pilchardus TaxID=27697 RepID=UPI002E15C988
METVMERECSALGGLFQTVIGDMKSSYPVWEDFISKAGKLQSQLRTTVVAVAAFLDAFQKVADLATGSRGGTRDIGSALTRMCMRHRSIEAKLRQFSMVFIDCLINPLQEQMEEWKRVANTLDKDHAKEYKKARQEIKKKSSDTLKLQKKAKKGRGDIQPQLDSAMQDVSDKYLLLEETEKQAVRKALIEERGRFCTFVTMLRPVVEEEMSMLGEITHLQAISDDLKTLTMDPHKLPPSSEQVIIDLKGSDYSWSYQTPPSSPSTTVSRKSSMCSSLNSVNSSDSRSSGSHSHSPTSHYRYRGSAPPQQGPARLPSVSSHDSGFISQDAYQSKSPSPMPPETSPQPSSESSSSDASESGQASSEGSPQGPQGPTQPGPNTDGEKLSNGYDHHRPPDSPCLREEECSLEQYLPLPPPVPSSACPTLSPTTIITTTTTTPTSPSPVWPWSRPSSSMMSDYPPYCPLVPGMMPFSSRVPSWKDWAKPGPYDQPMVNTLRRNKEKREPTSPLAGEASTAGEDPQRPRTINPSSLPKQEDAEAHEELAMALSRGLQLDIQHSSRDSLQCSSGYSTQTNTPCCSEDTIPSQVSDYDYFTVGGEQEVDQQDFDKSSTIPRNSDISQSYRRMFQSKRPASTAGLPSNAGPVILTPGVATIRRTPSSKPNLRRPSGGGMGPIPIRTPMVPVKTPTVPEFPAGLPFCEESETCSPPTTSPAGSPTATATGAANAGGNSPTSSPLAHTPGAGPHGDASAEAADTQSGQGDNMLLAIRRGVKLKKTTTNDRSAPRIA